MPDPKLELPDDPKPTTRDAIRERKRKIRSGEIKAPPRDEYERDLAKKEAAAKLAELNSEKQRQAREELLQVLGSLSADEAKARIDAMAVDDPENARIVLEMIQAEQAAEAAKKAPSNEPNLFGD